MAAGLGKQASNQRSAFSGAIKNLKDGGASRWKFAAAANSIDFLG